MTVGAKIVDTHAHYYPCYDMDQFFQSAADNMKLTPNQVGCLFIATSGRQSPLLPFRESTRLQSEWDLCETDEPESMLVCRSGQVRIVLLSARQITTREGLEVLGLGSGLPIGDGQEIGETIKQIQQHEALPVLPWGVGKWCLKRGRQLTATLKCATDENVPIFLGDVAARTQWLADNLTAEVRRHFRWLYGSDPLPIVGGERSVGRLACYLPGAIDERRPNASVIKSLGALTHSPRIVGSYEPIVAMLSNQFRLRFQRRAD